MGGPLGECARTPRTPGGPLVLTGHAGFMFQEENRLFHIHVGALDRKMENTRVFTLMHKPLNEGACARISSQSCRIVPQTQVGSPVVRLPLPRHSLPAAGLLPGRTRSNRCCFRELAAVCCRRRRRLPGHGRRRLP